MAKGKTRGKTRQAESLSFRQVLLGPEHNKEMDWQVEKEDREASMIYCLQPRRPLQMAVDIYQKKAKYMTPSAPTYSTKHTWHHLYFFDLVKALRAVMYPGE